VQGGLIRTAAPNAFRVEIEDQAATFYPLWYGSGAKGPQNGLFYVDQVGNVVIKGLVDGAVIKQTYLTPGTASSMRIATQYPSGMAGGKYVGKEAAVFPFLFLPRDSMTVWINDFLADPVSKQSDATNSLTLYGPQYSGTQIWGRLGSVSEMLVIRIEYKATCGLDANTKDINVYLQYQYNSEGWKNAWYQFHRDVGTGSQTYIESYSQTFFTRGTPWNTLKLRLLTQMVGTRNVGTWSVSGNFHVWTPNLGYVGVTTNTVSTTPDVDDLPANPRFL
jgi:hypothetical protein